MYYFELWSLVVTSFVIFWLSSYICGDALINRSCFETRTSFNSCSEVTEIFLKILSSIFRLLAELAFDEITVVWNLKFWVVRWRFRQFIELDGSINFVLDVVFIGLDYKYIMYRVMLHPNWIFHFVVMVIHFPWIEEKWLMAWKTMWTRVQGIEIYFLACDYEMVQWGLTFTNK